MIETRRLLAEVCSILNANDLRFSRNNGKSALFFFEHLSGVSNLVGAILTRQEKTSDVI